MFILKQENSEQILINRVYSLPAPTLQQSLMSFENSCRGPHDGEVGCGAVQKPASTSLHTVVHS